MEMSSEWVTLIIVIIGHAFATVWYASKAIAKLEEVNRSMARIDKELEKRDAQIAAIWKRIDELRDMVK